MKIEWLVNNLWFKVWALVLAVILWFYVAGEETIEKDFKILVKPKLADGFVVAEQSAEYINFSARGRKEVVSKLFSEEMISNIDLSNYNEPQTLVLSVDSKFLPLNDEIKVLRMAPEQIKIKIDRLIHRVLPIRVVTEGETADGYKIDGFIIDPVSVLLKGPEAYLKDKIYIDTEPLDVTGRQKPFRKMISLTSIPMVSEKASTQIVEVVVKIVEDLQKNQKSKKK